MAVAYALLANQRHNTRLLPKAAKQYSRALKQVNDAIQHPELAVEDEILGTVITLGIFEVRAS